MSADLALRQRIEARAYRNDLDTPREMHPVAAFDASVRQADAIGATGSRPTLLFYRIELTNEYPVTTAVCGGALVYVMCCVLHAWGLL